MDYGKRVKFTIDFPRYYVNGTYNVDGQLIFLQLKGRGPFEMQMGVYTE